MPNVNLDAVPTWIFTPNSSAASNLQLTNLGSSILYIGQSGVTPNTGIPLNPGQKPIELFNVTQTLYACSRTSPGTAAATASTSASVTVGTTSWTVASGGMANIPVGTYFLVGAGTSQEVLKVATSASTTTITTTTGTLFEHYASEVFTTATYTVGQLRVSPGVL